MGEVSPLRPAACPVNSDAVELLEEALERARSGETIAVAIVEVRLGGLVRESWSKTDHYHLLNSAVARLAVKLASVEDD